MKFFSLNKTALANRVFSGVKYDEGSFKSIMAKMLATFGYKASSELFTDDDKNLTVDVFADGEICPIFRKRVRDEHVFIMADGHKSDEIMKLLLTVDAAKRAGAKKITVIYPYAPYSRQDKNDHVRSSIGAKLLADMLQVAGVTRIITIEMHSPAIQGFYNIPVIHLNGNIIFKEYVKTMGISDVTICSPDHGAIKRNADFAKYFPDALAAVIDKKRKKPNEVASMEITGEENVIGRNVVCVDDMGDTLGTLAKASALVMSKGANSFRAFLTHPVLSGKALETLFTSTITELVVSDTIPSVYEKQERYESMLLHEAKLAVEKENGCEICYVDDDMGKSAIAVKLIEVRTKHPKFTIVSCDNLLINCVNRVVNKKSINELNVAEAE
jgi:ribose-phosphate pyrophosphokinase